MGRFGSAFVASVLAVAAAGITATAVFAADLPVPAAAPAYYPPPPAHYNWSGIYVGGLVGGAFADDTATTTTTTALQPAGTPSTVRPYSVAGGAEAGFNIEFAPFVIGAEATWTETNASLTQYTGALAGITEGFTSAPHWFATATGKIGFAANDLLFYAKGGGAWMLVNYTLATLTAGGLTGQQLISDTRSGWTVGAGVEYAFNEYLSAKLEYDYLGFNTNNYNFGNLIAGGVPVAIRSNIQLALAGVNFRFNWVKY